MSAISCAGVLARARSIIRSPWTWLAVSGLLLFFRRDDAIAVLRNCWPCLPGGVPRG